jgi:hypothetical protein
MSTVIVMVSIYLPIKQSVGQGLVEVVLLMPAELPSKTLHPYAQVVNLPVTTVAVRLELNNILTLL